MTIADGLRKAAEYLSEHGWAQRMMFNGHPGLNPPACAQGAIMQSCGPARFNVVDTALRQHLNSRLTGRPIDVPEWNDAPERTAEDVILELKRAAEECECPPSL